jgi:hypothetical protein
MFKVSLLAHIGCEGDEVNLRRDISLPFVPVKGMQIRFMDFADLNERLKQANAGSFPYEPTFYVGAVRWVDPEHRFELEPEEPETWQREVFLATLETRETFEEHVRLMEAVYGFKHEDTFEEQAAPVGKRTQR